MQILALRGVISLGKHEKIRNFERYCKESLTVSLFNILNLAVSKYKANKKVSSYFFTFLIRAKFTVKIH